MRAGGVLLYSALTAAESPWSTAVLQASSGAKLGPCPKQVAAVKMTAAVSSKRSRIAPSIKNGSGSCILVRNDDATSTFRLYLGSTPLRDCRRYFLCSAPV